MNIEDNGTPQEPAEELSLEEAFEAQSAEPEVQEEPEWVSKIPEHWGEEDRNVLRSGDPAQLVDWALNRHRSMESDYTRKTQSLAEERRQYERQLEFASQVKQLAAPIAQSLAHQGFDENQAVRAALSAYQQYVQDPRGVAEHLARQAGLKLAEEEQEFTDPNLRRLEQQQAQIAAYLQQQDHARQQAFQALQQQQTEKARTEVAGEIETFRNQRDANGQPLYPHYDKLKPKMAALMQAQGPDGNYLVTDLPDAYMKALAMTPELAKPAEDKVKKAKRAASGVSSHAGDTGAEYKTWNEAFRAYEESRA